MSPAAAVSLAKDLMGIRGAESERLDRIRHYLRDDPELLLTGVPRGVPREVQQLTRISRVNMVKFVVNSRVQAMYVDGYRTPRAADDLPVWKTWKRNGMPARQIGVHRAGLAYGASYAVTLPGDTGPTMRGLSPRKLTVSPREDDDRLALCALEDRGRGRYRLYDETSVYELARDQNRAFTVVDVRTHGATYYGEPVCPIVRYRDTEDLDDEVSGVVEPIMALQDQINITTFGLLVAQHYGAFRQRYILGWLAKNEEERLKASASQLWTFEDAPQDIAVGEFGQTDLSGYLDSREATLRHLATISQTPAHEMLGMLVNVSADALAAADAAHRRAVGENQTVMGAAHELFLNISGGYIGEAPDESASVRWRDTEARALSQVADALGKLAAQLQIPPQELWERIPGVTDDDIARWKLAREAGDPLTQLRGELDRLVVPEPGADNGA